MTLRSDDFEPSASASSASPPQCSPLHSNIYEAQRRDRSRVSALVPLVGRFFGFRPTYVDRRGIEAVLEVGRVVLLVHLDTTYSALRWPSVMIGTRARIAQRLRGRVFRWLFHGSGPCPAAQIPVLGEALGLGEAVFLG